LHKTGKYDKNKAWAGDDLQELVKKQAETIKRLEARIVELEGLIRELQETIARLQKVSRNSSKPPSSDIVKPKPKARKNNHGKPVRIGGQKAMRNMNARPSLRRKLTNSLM
jgi:predicted RNase H-like nuclease (RuvC/YqgF family)